MNDLFIKTPDWIFALPDQVSGWIISMMDQTRFGLFRDCADAEIPFSFPASTIAFENLKNLGRLERLAGYSDQALKNLASFIQPHQQPETGLFIDPCLDACFIEKENPQAYQTFRGAVTAYTIELLGHLGAKPLYPYSTTGKAGKADPAGYLEFVKTADWNSPWGTGSNAAGKTRELFFLINEGHEEFIPAVREGIEFILSKQNPETGMWGSSSIPLFEQISGTLKVIGRFQFWMGFEAPYLDRLADSCIRHHADRSFYAETDDICIPRNVAEMCMACLEHSDYRREDLLQTMVSIADYLRNFQMPDGAFAGNRKGTGPVGWCGSHICGPSQTPRGNMVGVAAALYCLALLSEYLGWRDLPWKFANTGWREKLADLKYKIIRSTTGKIDIVRK